MLLKLQLEYFNGNVFFEFTHHIQFSSYCFDRYQGGAWVGQCNPRYSSNHDNARSDSMLCVEKIHCSFFSLTAVFHSERSLYRWLCSSGDTIHGFNVLLATSTQLKATLLLQTAPMLTGAGCFAAMGSRTLMAPCCSLVQNHSAVQYGNSASW